MRPLPYIALILLLVGCSQADKTPIVQENVIAEVGGNDVEEILDALQNASDDYIMVAAHRGDWRDAPENSLQAITNCINMGVDIVEIDIRKTKDGQLVVIHDATIDRTTTGTGLVSDQLFDSLRTLHLRNGQGIPTHHQIPTLEEAMNLAKGKILVNLDKCWDYMPEAYAILSKTGTTHQAIFKGKDPYSDVREGLGTLLDSIIYMPIIFPNTENLSRFVNRFSTEIRPWAFEVIYRQEDSPVMPVIETINNQNRRVWVNTLWPDLCADHHDDLAVIDPDASWGWVIDHGATILQTDRPELMLEYLRDKGLHP